MIDIRQLGYELAINFRDKHQLGNYCSNNLLNILEILEEYEQIKIELIRTPFNNKKLAGFIGFKNDTFVIVTNSNQSLGNERFTIAHEICHLLQNRVFIKENNVKEEFIDGVEDHNELIANGFAAELLMPERDIVQYIKKMNNQTNKLDVHKVIHLQQKYGVDYIAMTRRLREVGVISHSDQDDLESMLSIPGELETVTKKLGYTNSINLPSKDTFILQRDLEVIKSNYDKGYTSYDDLIRIFGYLGCEPEKYGYSKDSVLTEEAIDLIKSLKE
jgi:Zn-dependent peptidase ImmA (M78 family)